MKKDSKMLQLDPVQKSEYRKLLKLIHPVLPVQDVLRVKNAVRSLYNAVETLSEHEKDEVFTGAISIASTVSEDVGLGASSVIAALFYRAVERGYMNLEQIRTDQGNKPAELIQGLLQISGLEMQTADDQAENFRQLLLTMAADVRVILIKLAERLIIMRGMNNLDLSTRLNISWEAFNLYAPLAHRLGLYNLKSELEDLAMKNTDPENYTLIDEKIKETARKRNRFIKEFTVPIEKELENHGFSFQIRSRTKAIWSIWNKMKKQQVDFEEVYDVFAIRIILDSEPKKEKEDCWRVYSIVTDLYQPNPLRLRDWISIPKSNGYESLHTTVIGPGGTWVEVQIRTRRMDEIAEKGFAAHWKYKGVKDDKNIEDWLLKIREMLGSTGQGDTTGILDEFRMNPLNKEVFVFTPKGDLKKFPKGATILDFAFDIHSQVGSNCVGAKVNGKNVPIRYVLQNGDRIEIIQSKAQKPKTDWLNYVVTSKAKSRIKQYLKEEIVKEAENGKEILMRRFKNWKIEYSDENIRKLLTAYKLKTAADLYYRISTEQVDLGEIKEMLTTTSQPAENKIPQPDESPAQEAPTPSLSHTDDFLLIDEKLENIDYKLAKCCTPIFGDEIFGFVTVNDGIKIHRINCPNARQLLERYGYRVVKAKWANPDSDAYFETVLRITGVDEIGVVNRLTDVISRDLKVNMRSISLESGDGLYEGTLRVLVKDKNHMEVLIHKLLKVKGVLSAVRLDNL